jgi:hypothetical protein
MANSRRVSRLRSVAGQSVHAALPKERERLDSPDGMDARKPRRVRRPSTRATQPQFEVPAVAIEPVPAGAPEGADNLVFHNPDGEFAAVGLLALSKSPAGVVRRIKEIHVYDGKRWSTRTGVASDAAGALANFEEVHRAAGEGGTVLWMPHAGLRHVDYVQRRLESWLERSVTCWTTGLTPQITPQQAGALQGAALVVGQVGTHVSADGLDAVDMLRRAGVDVVAVALVAPQESPKDPSFRALSSQRHVLLEDSERAVAQALAVKFRPFDEPISLSAEDHLVPGLLPPGLCLLYGPPGSGKSTVTAALVGAVVSGGEWAGKPVKPGAALVLCGEDRDGMHLRVQTWLRQSDALRDHQIVVAAESMAGDDVTAFFERVTTAIDQIRARLVVLDTLLSLAPGLNENDPAAMSDLVGRLRDLVATRPDLTVLVLHHPAKGKGRESGPRGHGSLMAALDASLEAKRTGNAVNVTVRKGRNFVDGATAAFRLTSSGDFVVAVYSPDAPTDAAGPTGPREHVLRALRTAGPAGLTVKQMQDSTGVSKASVYQHLKSLQTERLVVRMTSPFGPTVMV